MENRDSNFKYVVKRITQTLGLGIFAVMTLIIGGIFVLVWFVRGCDAQTASGGKIEMSPMQIQKIKSIGQWEFLAISDEELVDTVRHGFFGDDELSRIYYGTLRLGLDLRDAEEGWIETDHDTITATLPPISLLDERFVDEARTKAFYEEGKWSDADKAKLTKKARYLMKRRCLTPENFSIAEQNATEQFKTLLRSMGFEYVKVRFKTGQNAG